MKKLLVIIVLLVTGVSVDTIAQDLVFEDVSKQQFAELVKSGDGLLVDLRTPKEYNEGHIEGAVNIDYFSDNFEAEIDKLDKGKTMYIYCASGGRSGKTMKMLKLKGFERVYHLPVGYNGWSAK